MQLGRLDPETTANIGIVAGGCARNIIPATCALKGEARSHNPAKLAAQVEHMSACLREAARLIGAEVEIDLKHDFTAFALAPDSPIVQRAAAAARRLGIEPQTEKGGGGSDANVFNEHGLPSLMMATGASGRPHPSGATQRPRLSAVSGVAGGDGGGGRGRGIDK